MSSVPSISDKVSDNRTCILMTPNMIDMCQFKFMQAMRTSSTTGAPPMMPRLDHDGKVPTPVRCGLVRSRSIVD